MIPHDVHLILASGFAWYTALLLAGLALLLTVRAYPAAVRRAAGPRWMLPAFFRFLGALSLALLLLRPELDVEKTRTDPHTLLLLLDASASMSLRDAEDGPTRLRSATLVALDCERALAQTTGLSLRVVPFADAPQHPLSGEDILQAETSGDESDLGAALALATEITPPVQRVLLLSDGNDTTGLDPIQAATALKLPVDTVAVGRDVREDETYRDVFLDGLEHRDSTPVGSVTQVVANVDAAGFSGRTVEVVLRSGAETLARGELVLDAIKGAQPVTLNFHPTTPGLMDLTVTVSPLAGERLAENNTLSFPLAVHERLPRVVYVEGALRPDYKFLRRALATDPGLEFMSLVRVRHGDFLRQGTVGGIELDGIPKSKAELAAFDVLILGDLTATEIGTEVLTLLRSAVSEGLGLLVLPGPATTGARSDYGGSPLAAAFPALPARESVTQGVAVFLTPGGADHVLGEGLKRFFARQGESPEQPLPPLSGVSRVARLRATATTVLAARVGTQDLPVLVTGRFGKGKVALFLGHDAWRWSLGARGATGPYAQVWGQLARWLAAAEDVQPDTGPAFAVTANRLVARAGEEVVLSASLRGVQAGQPPQVEAEVHRGDKVIDRLGFSAVPGLEGVFQARFATRRAGKYVLKVNATAGTQALATRTLSVRVRGGRGEFERLSPDRRLLARMARETGGREVELTALADRVGAYGAAERTRQEIVHIPLWHAAGLFLALSFFLGLEWALRKRAGLP